MTEQLIGQLVSGLVAGAAYALMGSGLSLIWGTLKTLNFAHGEFYMMGGFAIFVLFGSLGIPPIISIPVSILIVSFICILIEKILIQPLLDKPNWHVSSIVVTLAAGIILQNMALRIWGERFQNVPYFNSQILEIAGVRVSAQRIIILVVAISVIAIFVFFLKKTRIGWAVRATSQDRDAAVLMGINTYSIYTLIFGISGALAALAATMLTPIYSANPWMGNALILKAFVICVFGGLGSLEGAILAGFIVGTVESLGVMLWSSEWKDFLSYALLVLVLWIRPAGLFGSEEW